RLGRLAADLPEHVHVLRDGTGYARLLLRRARDVLHERGDLVRNLLDLVERGARVLGEQRAADDVRRAALHRHDGLVRVGLDRAHEHFDLLRRARRALGELLDLVRDDREAAARLPRGRSFDRRVEREGVRLLGDLLDELDDVADLLRALAEALDALRGVLDRLADRVHARDRAPHGLAALVRDLDRVARHVGAALRVARH